MKESMIHPKYETQADSSATDRLSLEILRFLQEEAMIRFSDFPEVFDVLVLQKHPGISSPLETDGTYLCYEPQLLCSHFLSSPDKLRLLYVQIHLKSLGLQDPASRNSRIQKELLSFISEGFGTKGKSWGNSRETADIEKQTSVDYRHFLQRFTVPKEEAVLDMDAFDYIPYHYGLTYYGNMPFLEPLEYREVNGLDELAIAIDTSGSCSGSIVRRFLTETWNILSQRENFFSKMRLHLLQCDSILQEHRIFTSVEEWEEALPHIKILGHGNTDFRPVFSYLDRLIAGKEIRHLRGLLYFSDGDGIFPEKKPAYETAFIFLNRETEKHKLPDWAIRLNLELPIVFSKEE